MGDSKNIQRLVPVRATPEGQQHHLDPAEPVTITLRLSNPRLDYTADGHAVLWTRNAVFVVWREETSKAELRSGWLPPDDVVRKNRKTAH